MSSSLLVALGGSLQKLLVVGNDLRLGKLTPALDSSILSPTASLAASARVPREALESLATFLLASLEAPEVASLTLSPTTVERLVTRYMEVSQ